MNRTPVANADNRRLRDGVVVNARGGIGSNGATPRDRANAAGHRGSVAETAAINPALVTGGLRRSVLAAGCAAPADRPSR